VSDLFREDADQAMHTKAIKENSLEHGLSRILVEDGMFDNIPVQSLKVLRQPAQLMFKV